MVYAEIKIQIEVDESKLTKEQQETAENADTNLAIAHPLENGVCNLQDTIFNIASQSFSYLEDGAAAVRIRMED